MTKHIIGLIIFTLIIGTSIVIAGFSDYSARRHGCRKHQTKHKLHKKKKHKSRCLTERNPHSKEFNTSLTQVVFATDTLTTNLSVANGISDREVDLHFFVNDEFGTQYLRKETILVSSNKNLYENSFAWLNHLESRKNLYVMAVAKQERRNFDYQPSFDPSTATPVLLQSKE